MRGLTLAAALAAALASGLGWAAPPALADDPVSLTLPQARIIAQQALAAGNPRVTVTLARGLLQANPQDANALVLLAQVLEAQGQHRSGRRAAARAFQVASDKPDRFMAAQIAARNAYAGGQFGLAQYWLRRSLDPAPTDRLRDQAVADFKRVRAANPWNTRLQMTVQPSDNVNSGTDNPYLIVEGLPFYGTHSASAMALSGTVLRIEAATRYRLWQNDAGITHLTGQISTSRVDLSAAAQAAAPTVTNRDLSGTLVEIGLSHLRPAGQGARTGGVWGASGAIGQVWNGGDLSYNYAKLGISRTVPLGQAMQVRLQGSYERRDDPDAAFPRSDHLQLRSDLTARLSAGRSVAVGLVLDQADSNRGNVTATHRTAYVSYGFGDITGPVDLRMSLGARNSDFPRYFIGAFAAPGGRQDDAVFASLDVTLTEIGYAGFVPRISLITQRTTSNISRFETRSTALSIGIESKF